MISLATDEDDDGDDDDHMQETQRSALHLAALFVLRRCRCDDDDDHHHHHDGDAKRTPDGCAWIVPARHALAKINTPTPLNPFDQLGWPAGRPAG